MRWGNGHRGPGKYPPAASPLAQPGGGGASTVEDSRAEAQTGPAPECLKCADARPTSVAGKSRSGMPNGLLRGGAGRLCALSIGAAVRTARLRGRPPWRLRAEVLRSPDVPPPGPIRLRVKYLNEAVLVFVGLSRDRLDLAGRGPRGRRCALRAAVVLPRAGMKSTTSTRSLITARGKKGNTTSIRSPNMRR